MVPRAERAVPCSPTPPPPRVALRTTCPLPQQCYGFRLMLGEDRLTLERLTTVGAPPPPRPLDPPPPDQSDHRVKKRNLPLGKSCRAIFGTQSFRSPPPLRQRQTIRYRGLVPTPPPSSSLLMFAGPEMRFVMEDHKGNSSSWTPKLKGNFFVRGHPRDEGYSDGLLWWSAAQTRGQSGHDWLDCAPPAAGVRAGPLGGPGHLWSASWITSIRPCPRALAAGVACGGWRPPRRSCPAPLLPRPVGSPWSGAAGETPGGPRDDEAGQAGGWGC